MRSPWVLIAAILASSTFAFAQSFEASVGGGETVIPSKNAVIGTSSTDPASGNYNMKDGFRLHLADDPQFLAVPGP